MKQLIRTLIIVPILRLTGYRFSKYHRHYETWLYRMFNTTLANLEAELASRPLPELHEYLDGPSL